MKKTLQLVTKNNKLTNNVKLLSSKKFNSMNVQRFYTTSTQTPTKSKFQNILTLKASEMFCFQCEQTQDHNGCKTVGVCGKTPEVSALQDLLIFQTRRLAVYLNELLKEGVDAKELFERNKV
jgi:hypothetical protein